MFPRDGENTMIRRAFFATCAALGMTSIVPTWAMLRPKKSEPVSRRPWLSLIEPGSAQWPICCEACDEFEAFEQWFADQWGEWADELDLSQRIEIYAMLCDAYDGPQEVARRKAARAASARAQ